MQKLLYLYNSPSTKRIYFLIPLGLVKLDPASRLVLWNSLVHTFVINISYLNSKTFTHMPYFTVKSVSSVCVPFPGSQCSTFFRLTEEKVTLMGLEGEVEAEG